MAARNNILIMSWGMPQIMRYTSKALTRLGYTPFTVFRAPAAGGNSWVRTAVEYIEQHHPGYLFSWQRLYGQGRPIWRAANAWKVRHVVMDFGLWPHYMSAFYDPQGENRESALVGNFDAIEDDPKQAQIIKRQMPVVNQIRDQILAVAAQAKNEMSGTPLKKLPPERDFVFLALQRCARGRPDKVLELDAVPSRREPIRVARDVITECERQGKFCVIKQHPQGINVGVASKSIQDPLPERGPNHWLMPMVKGRGKNEALFSWCIANCSHLVTVNSTTWSLALICDKPVSCLGRGWYSMNKIVNECKLVRDAIPTPESSGERGKRFVALMLSRQLRHEFCERPNKVREVLKRIYPDFV